MFAVFLKIPTSDFVFFLLEHCQVNERTICSGLNGAPRVNCGLNWCFPCPLKELNEEVVREVHPQPAGGALVGFHCLPSHTDVTAKQTASVFLWWGTWKHPEPLVLMGKKSLQDIKQGRTKPLWAKVAEEVLNKN